MFVKDNKKYEIFQEPYSQRNFSKFLTFKIILNVQNEPLDRGRLNTGAINSQNPTITLTPNLGDAT